MTSFVLWESWHLSKYISHRWRKAVKLNNEDAPAWYWLEKHWLHLSKWNILIKLCRLSDIDHTHKSNELWPKYMYSFHIWGVHRCLLHHHTYVYQVSSLFPDFYYIIISQYLLVARFYCLSSANKLFCV